MRLLSVWAMEFIKLLGGKRLHPVVTQCPMCKQMVRLHVDKAGRRHVFRHARTLYEGSRLRVHYTAEMKCVGSGTFKMFDPRPNEPQRFKLPDILLDDNPPAGAKSIAAVRSAAKADGSGKKALTQRV